MDLQRFPGQAENLLNSRMIRLVPEIRVSSTTGLNILESLLEFISEEGHSHTVRLKKLSLDSDSDNDAELIHKIAPDILAAAAMKLKTLGAQLTSPQLEAVLVRLADTPDSR